MLALFCPWPGGIYSLARRDPNSTEGGRAFGAGAPRASPASWPRCAAGLEPAANISVGEGCSAQWLVALPSWYPFSLPSQLRNAVPKAGGYLGSCASPPDAQTPTWLCLRRVGVAQLARVPAPQPRSGGLQGGRGLCHAQSWRKALVGTLGFIHCVGGWLRERQSGGFARAARRVEPWRVLRQAVGKGWS